MVMYIAMDLLVYLYRYICTLTSSLKKAADDLRRHMNAMTLQLPIVFQTFWKLEALPLPHKQHQGLLACHKDNGAISVFLHFESEGSI